MELVDISKEAFAERLSWLKAVIINAPTWVIKNYLLRLFTPSSADANKSVFGNKK